MNGTHSTDGRNLVTAPPRPPSAPTPPKPEKPKPPRPTADDVRVCNCAHCARELVGTDPLQDGTYHDYLALVSKKQAPVRRRVGGRIMGRPYCGECLKAQYPAYLEGRGYNGELVNDKDKFS